MNWIFDTVMSFLENIFWKLGVGEEDKEIEEENEKNRLLVAEEAFRTGKIVYGEVGDDGKLTFTYEDLK